MKKRPIVLQAREVLALLGGHKTQLRRPYKDVPMLGDISQRSDLTTAWLEKFGANTLCPIGHAGQRLYVRETLREGDKMGDWYYAADGTSLANRRCKELNATRQSVPAATMPWWASRLTLKILKVELQRLHEITGNPSDAAAEMGWEEMTPGTVDFWRDPSDQSWCRHPDEEFPAWWDAVYGKKTPWASDPWIWAITFERIKP